MLKQLTVINSRGMPLQLEMLENESGYQIADIDGLDPGKATLTGASYAGLDGDEFQSARRGPRNIKIQLELQPDSDSETYFSLRQKLYTYFRLKSEISMRFLLTSGLYLDIKGIVEDHTSPMFVQDPRVDISVMCYQPDFIDPRMVTVESDTVSDTTNEALAYPGTIEAGTVLTLHVNRTLTSFSIYNTGEDGILSQLDFAGSLIADDELVVSSVSRAKGITLVRGGISTSYLYGRPVQSGWIQFQEGINNFRVYATGAPIPYTLEYLVRYGGL